MALSARQSQECKQMTAALGQLGFRSGQARTRRGWAERWASWSRHDVATARPSLYQRSAWKDTVRKSGVKKGIAPMTNTLGLRDPWLVLPYDPAYQFQEPTVQLYNYSRH
ncbi:hypothetical protein RRG08_029766 [Elysia crispata]|uniref:Uncharacterized protein n=1 Tax=Elysia crispata TaxID=231223 RepID=A0AAE1B611_9GAST|nr:hypothetical protein RRG08_029766 [Elysia crispata]